MFFLVFALLLSFGVAFFAVQNSTVVTVKLFLWSYDTSLVIVILGSASFGALVILLLHLFAQIRVRWELRRAYQRIKELEGQLEQIGQHPTATAADSGKDPALQLGVEADKNKTLVNINK